MATRNNGKSKSVGLKKSGSGHGVGPWLGLAVIWILLDQLTKVAISKTFVWGESRPITGFFNLVLAYNKGAAFSFLAAAGGWQRWFLTAVAVAVSVVVVFWLTRLKQSERILGVALGLVLGGGVGNLIDRVSLGYVVDFISWHYNDWYWPAFNIADSAICLGAVLLVWDSFFGETSK